jgi:hypothetical protein
VYGFEIMDRKGGEGRTQSRFCGVSSMVSITSRPGREDWRSGYDWGKISRLVAGRDVCWIVVVLWLLVVVVWPEVLDIGGVGMVADMLDER